MSRAGLRAAFRCCAIGLLCALPLAEAAGAGASPTVTVRVLEHFRPLEAEVQASSGSVRCDGQVLEGGKLSLRAEGKAIVLGARRCQGIRFDGPGVTISLGAQKRGYRGALRVGTADAHLAFFNEVPLEDYLQGVLGSETTPGAPEALLAQAVVSRTYALASRARHRAAGYDLCDLTHCQLYRGREDERADSNAAVAQTSGEVLLVGGVVLRPAYFHAVCGGATSSAADVFGDEGLVASTFDSVDGGPPLCSSSPEFAWTWRVDRPTLSSRLGFKNDGRAFEPLRRDRAGRVLEARVFGHRLSGRELLARAGRAFGYQELKSMKVSAEEAEGVVLFTGNGRGHGVGLCQEGARAAAERGWKYRRILAHYFPNSAARPLP